MMLLVFAKSSCKNGGFRGRLASLGVCGFGVHSASAGLINEIKKGGLRNPTRSPWRLDLDMGIYEVRSPRGPGSAVSQGPGSAVSEREREVRSPRGKGKCGLREGKGSAVSEREREVRSPRVPGSAVSEGARKCGRRDPTAFRQLSRLASLAIIPSLAPLTTLTR
jgi:hypothetical protein